MPFHSLALRFNFGFLAKAFKKVLHTSLERGLACGVCGSVAAPILVQMAFYVCSGKACSDSRREVGTALGSPAELYPRRYALGQRGSRTVQNRAGSVEAFQTLRRASETLLCDKAKVRCVGHGPTRFKVSSFAAISSGFNCVYRRSMDQVLCPVMAATSGMLSPISKNRLVAS